MSPPGSRFDGVSYSRIAAAVLLTSLLGSIFAIVDEPISPLLGVAAVLSVTFLVTSVFTRVRERPAYDVVRTATSFLFFALWHVGSDQRGLIPLVLLGLMAVGVLIELYNYWRGTSYLHIGL